jgi:hypothetical protein
MLGEKCSCVSVVEGSLTCEFTLEEPIGGYWGDVEAQDAAMELLVDAAGIPEEDRENFCKNFPWHPKQIGGCEGCGYDFACSECGQSFWSHSHGELESGECLG